MTWLLDHLGTLAGPVALFAGGAAAYHFGRKMIRDEALDQFKGAAQPFMDAIKPLLGLPKDMQTVQAELAGQRQMIEGIRSALGQVAQTANDAHAMAVKALEKASTLEGAHGATRSTLDTHLFRYPHKHDVNGE